MFRRDFLGLAASAAVLPCTRLSAQAVAAASSPARRPVEDFAALPFMEGPSLSPDGTRVASKIAVDNILYFAISPLFGGGKPSLFRAGDGDINWWRWVNDDWLVLGIGDVIKVQGEDFYIRRALGVSAEGSKMVQLAWRDAAQGADDVIWIADDGTPRIRLALQKSIYLSDENFWPQVIEIDVSTGKSRTVVRPYPSVASWYADGSGTVRIGIGATAEGRSLRLLYREREGQGFDTIERANSRKGQKLLLPSLFLPEPGQALAIDDRDGFDALYRLDLKTMALGERVFGTPGRDIDGIVTDRMQTRLLGVRVTDTAPTMHWIDEELREMQAALDQAVPGRRATIVSMDSKRERLLVHVGAGDRPGTYYFITTAGGKMQRLAHVNSRIAAGKLHPVRTIRYKARDGLEIAAVLTLPAGLEAKRLPLVVMPHGGPFSQDLEEWDWWSQFLADRGYAVVQPNYRGSSGYGTDFSEKGEGQWGLAMQDDLNDAPRPPRQRGTSPIRSGWRWSAVPMAAMPRCGRRSATGRSTAARSPSPECPICRHCSATTAGFSTAAEAMTGCASRRPSEGRLADQPSRTILDSNPARPRQEGSARTGEAVARAGGTASQGGQERSLCRAARGRPPCLASGRPGAVPDRAGSLPEGARSGLTTRAVAIAQALPHECGR
jgi:hypothetical protein